MGLALVLAYIALNLLSPADLFPGLEPYHPMLVIGLASVLVALFAHLKSPGAAKPRTQFVLVTLFFAFATCSWFPHGGLRANLTAFQNLFPNLLVYYTGLVLLRSPLQWRLVRVTLMLVAIYVIAAAYAQVPIARITAESTPYVLVNGDETNLDLRIRGLGILNDPNILGQFLLLVLPLLFISKRDTGLGRGYLFAIPSAVVLLIGVYLTYSRGAFSGLAVLISLFLIHRFKKAGSMAAAIVGSGALVAINAGKRTISMSGGMDRLAIWSDGMSFFKSSPLWGIGYGGFVERDDWTAHNSYLLCAAELGIIGFFLWMGALLVTIIQLNRVPKVVGKSNPALARWAVGMKISLGGYLFTSYFLSCTYNPLLFLLLGMSGAIIAAAGGDEALPLRDTNWQVKALGICVGILTLIYVMLRLRAV
jgi:putative inorganic carbon (HCO3(-)) transporter